MLVNNALAILFLGLLTFGCSGEDDNNTNSANNASALKFMDIVDAKQIFVSGNSTGLHLNADAEKHLYKVLENGAVEEVALQGEDEVEVEIQIPDLVYQVTELCCFQLYKSVDHIPN